MRPIGPVAFAILTVIAAGSSWPDGSQAQPATELVTLPNGDSVSIGAEGRELLGAYDNGRLEALLWQLVDADRTDDAIAVLAYVARYRPSDAPRLAVMGLRIVADLQDSTRAGLVLAAVVQESGASIGEIAAAVRRAGLPAEFAPGIDLAALTAPADNEAEDDAERAIPNDGANPGAGQGQAAGPPGTERPAGPPAGTPNFGTNGGGGGGGFGGGLPIGLIIGGGNAGPPNSPPITIPDPPPNGGVSG